MATRSSRLWWEVRPAKVSTGQRINVDIYAMPANTQVWEADDEQQAAELVDKVNAAILTVRGM